MNGPAHYRDAEKMRDHLAANHDDPTIVVGIAIIDAILAYTALTHDIHTVRRAATREQWAEVTR